MALTKITANVAVHSALDDYPSDNFVNTAAFKAYWDSGCVALKSHINDTLIPEIEAYNALGLTVGGAYNPATAYTEKTLVTYSGSTYLTLQDVTGATPTNDGTNYLLIAQKGDVGANVLHNSDFQINQRLVTGTVSLSAGQYGHDRWKAGASGCTYTFASSGGVTTLTISAGSLIQVVEGVNLETDTYCLSWVGTAQGKIGSGSYGNSGVTANVVGGANLNVEFSAGTLAKPKLEQGAVATPYKKPDDGEQLALCRRYLMVLNASVPYGEIISGQVTSSSVFSTVTPTALRITPTITAIGTFSIVVYTATSPGYAVVNITNNADIYAGASMNGFTKISVKNLSLTSYLGFSGSLRAENDATAKLILSADL